MKYTFGTLLLVSLFLLGIQTISCKNGSGEMNTETSAPETTAYKNAVFLEKEAFTEGMKKGNAVILDVRMPQNFEQGHIDGAINVNFFDPTFKSQLLSLDKNKDYYVYCKNGSSSQRAAEFMMKNDYPTVYVLQGGYDNYVSTEN